MILRTILRRSHQGVASFSSASTTSQPLLLWLGGDDGAGKPSPRRLLIPPPIQTTPHIHHVTSVDEIQAAVTAHYTSDALDVGGMGEQDSGVWFANTDDDDILDESALLRESIQQIKQERHGVPFGVCTTGLTKNDVEDVASIGLSVLNVSLLAASPPDYAAATGGQGDNFGRVCGFIVNAVEKGIAVEVSVLPDYAGAARDLGHSLGARQVHIVEQTKEAQQ